MPLMRRELLVVGLLALSVVIGGCAGQQQKKQSGTSAYSHTAAKKEEKKDSWTWLKPPKVDWNKLNPVAWDYRKFGNDFREQYQFKIGDMWVIKPPVEPNPVKLEVLRAFGHEPMLEETVQTSEAVVIADESEAISETEVPPTTQPASTQSVQPNVEEAFTEPDQEIVPPADHQRMVIDLVSGSASLTDVDGRIFPLQLQTATLERLRTLSRQREWMIRSVKPLKDAQDPVYYKLVAFEADYSQQHHAHFAVPGRKEFPEFFELLIDEFEQAHRLAHPLSKSVNLLD